MCLLVKLNIYAFSFGVIEVGFSLAPIGDDSVNRQGVEAKPLAADKI